MGEVETIDGLRGLRAASLNTGSMRPLWEGRFQTAEAKQALHDALTSIVLTHRLDVLFLQEAKVVFDVQSMRVERVGTDVYVNSLLEDGRFTTAFPQGGQSETRNPVLTSFPIEHASSVRLLPGSAIDAPASRFTIQWRGRTVIVYNVHLRSYNAGGRAGSFVWWDPRSWAERLRIYKEDILVRGKQAARLRALLELEEAPFIVAGDLNATPHNWSYAHLMRGNNLTPAGSVRSGTYPSRLPIVRIDYIFASSPDWVIIDADVTDPHMSDHRLVAAELVLRSANHDDGVR